MEIIEFAPLAGSDARVVGYLHTPIWEMTARRESYPAVVICPGGGYAWITRREADPAALPFFARGYNVFILTYSVKEQAKNFQPLIELSETVRALRETKEWRVDGKHIAVCGFSAGGHLAASLGTMWDDPELLKRYDNHGGANRANAMILCYPAIAAGEYANEVTLRWVSGCEPGTPGYAYFSLDRHVSKNTCPAFLWHTAADELVPVENTLLFALALQKQKVPYEVHIFPEGPHGLSACTYETGCPNDPSGKWVALAVDWLDRQFGFKQ